MKIALIESVNPEWNEIRLQVASMRPCSSQEFRVMDSSPATNRRDQNDNSAAVLLQKGILKSF